MKRICQMWVNIEIIAGIIVDEGYNIRYTCWDEILIVGMKF